MTNRTIISTRVTLAAVLLSLVAIFALSMPQKASGELTVASKSAAPQSIAAVPQAAPTYVPPCPPLVDNAGTWVTFECLSEVNNQFDWQPLVVNQATDLVKAIVTTECPLNVVERAPYPRTIVTQPTVFTLKNQTENVPVREYWSDVVQPTRDVVFLPNGIVKQWRSLRIGLRSRYLPAGTQWFNQSIQAPTWEVDRTRQNAPREIVRYIDHGETLTFQWGAASYFGLPKKGRNFDFINQRPADRYDLNAYEVKAKTACGHEWALAWQELVSLPDGRGNIWQDRSIVWQPLNLTGLNGMTTASAMQDQSVGTGYFPGTGLLRQKYTDNISGIWVPVVEVQTVQQ